MQKLDKKGLFTHKIDIVSFAQTFDIPNLYGFLSSVHHKKIFILRNVSVHFYFCPCNRENGLFTNIFCRRNINVPSQKKKIIIIMCIGLEPREGEKIINDGVYKNNDNFSFS